ncbi:acyltransferase [Bradyrhizobium manausense]|uniref:acyltransferase family protein n=1 Tax=Bradyrhizobium manausense TaxID=989370 RepID=UPI001BA965CB|nr:acyltransferase [Bradyrhizobium manausense]MBR1092290.1 acyltransferase [Bradyrhizobium manausense]
MTHIKEFDALRGVLSLWVMLGHWATAVGLSFSPVRPDLYNVLAVDVFFILSGFVICSLCLRTNENYSAYLLRRAFRIFPAYLVVLVGSWASLDKCLDILRLAPPTPTNLERVHFIQSALERPLTHVGTHLLLLQGAFPTSFDATLPYTIVGQAWSISVEWQYYIIAPALVALVFGKFSLKRLVLLGLLVTAFRFYGRFAGAAFVGSQLHLFALGFLSLAVWTKASSKEHVSLAQLRAGSSLAGLFFSISFPHALPILVWIAALHIAIVGARNEVGTIEWIICSAMRRPTLQFLGRISYSLYISHMLVLMFCMSVAETFARPPLAFAVLLLVLFVPLTIAVSAVFFNLIELPAMNLARRLTRGSKARTRPIGAS